MVDLNILRERGLTQENLKSWLQKDLTTHPASQGYATGSDGSPDAKRAMLINRIRSRIDEGRNRNLKDFRVWAAINEVWDNPHSQISPALVQSLMDRSPDDGTTQELMKSYGITDDLIDVVDDPKTAGKTIRRFNRPAFWQVYVPLARSISVTRWASLVNARDQVPFLKYEPAVSTKINRFRGELLTNRVEVASRQYNYLGDYKQSALYLLKYGVAYEIPYEEWDFQMQEVSDEALARKDGDGNVQKDESGKMTQLVREGIRYYHPHPSRSFCDQAYGPSTFNTDTGCSYFGTWKVAPFREVYGNKKFWNTDSVSVGASDAWWTGANAFFEAVYGGTTMSFPQWTAPDESDRESRMAWNVYDQSMEDKAVQLTEYFERLVPKDNGLGDYEYPVWFRFVMAGDDTILYAAPLPYCPVTYAGYDSDEYSSRNSSMVLEAIPFQNQFENLLSQHLYSVRQNLMNISFIDEEAVSPAWITKLRNMGEKLVRGVNLIPFSSKLWSRKQLKPENVVQNFRFPQLNTQETMQAMNMILDIMDRVLLMSKQEMGQQASHEQSREEVRILSQSGSQRFQFVALPLNQQLEAKKVQLYKGLMAYGEDEFYSQVPTEEYVTPELLAELGFTADQGTLSTQLAAARSENPNQRETMTLKVKKSQIAIPLHMFIATRDGADRINNAEGGAAMLQFVAQASSNPNWVSAAGMPQLIELTNMALQTMGFPRDFRIRATGETPEQQAEELQKALQGVMQQVEQKIAPMDEGLKKHGEVIKQLAEAMQMQLPPNGGNAV